MIIILTVYGLILILHMEIQVLLEIDQWDQLFHKEVLIQIHLIIKNKEVIIIKTSIRILKITKDLIKSAKYKFNERKRVYSSEPYDISEIEPKVCLMSIKIT